MAKFNPGDKVLVNGALVAIIHTYDEDNDRLVYVSEIGGGTDTTYGHISQTRVELLLHPAAPVVDEPDSGNTAVPPATESVDSEKSSEK